MSPTAVAAGDAEAALATADEAVVAAPLLADAHDLRAVLLANLGRREEAIAACAPEAFGKEIPIALRGLKVRAAPAAVTLRRNILLFGVGGLLLPFPFIKLIDVVISGLGLA